MKLSQRRSSPYQRSDKNEYPNLYKQINLLQDSSKMCAIDYTKFVRLIVSLIKFTIYGVTGTANFLYWN